MTVELATRLIDVLGGLLLFTMLLILAAGQVFRALADVDLRMICQGASERNISFLVDETKAEESVRRLHQLFFAGPQEQGANAGSYPMCQAGGSWQ